MSISASKRIKTTLTNSPECNSVCDLAYTHCFSLTQHTFEGVLPYQLPVASDHIHVVVSTTHKHPLILKWVSFPPTICQINSICLIVAHQQLNKIVLYAEAIMGNACKAVLARVPIGAAGIGAVIRLGSELVGVAIGVYARGCDFNVP
ncbi:hypothetical protein P3X46_020075 [Hevea brasiliensis]|uniref:Uncharacterized protein n=1 Tax=Hevea brasiliensis TaxID=3981 RepID=A0ABQ9LM51_HEVBR|nr:hypothetical protein P3X46_020075 [Hevea brasiliensis]